MKRQATAILLGAALSLAAGQASAEKLILKFGHVGNPGSLFEASVDEFGEECQCKAGRSSRGTGLRLFSAWQGQGALAEAQAGTDHVRTPPSIMSSVADEFGVFEMPYIVQSREHMKAIQAEMGESVFGAAAESKGYRILGYFENGFRHITNNTRPISTPEDLKGIKLRTPNGEWRVKMFQLYGANPTPMALSEVFTALKTGVIDGQENPYAQIWSSKFQEVQQYLSITGHVYTPAYVLTSAKSFAKLPDDIQSDLIAAAEESQDAVYTIAAQLETELLQNLKDANVEVNEADKQAFIDSSAPIYEEFANSVEGGAELISTVQSLAR